jgi:hypothetical protein
MPVRGWHEHATYCTTNKHVEMRADTTYNETVFFFEKATGDLCFIKKESTELQPSENNAGEEH